jgi:hypothetical protein
MAIIEKLDVSEQEAFAREDFEKLIEQYAVFPEPAPGEAVFNEGDEWLTVLETAFKNLGEHQFLDLSGDVIPDWRGTKYHIKTDGIWTEAEIADAGVLVPEGAVLPNDLTEEQRKEIAEQKEAARIASLEPEEREKELKARLIALADEAEQLSRRAHIQGEEFDPVAWYQENKEPIEKKYAS